MSGVQTLTPCGFLCVSTMSFSRKLSNPCNRLWNWHGVEYLFVEWMNGMDGWLDEQMLILSIVSHLHQLMTWSSGISLSTLGWEPWRESPLRGSCVPLRNPWMAGVSASGLSSVLSLLGIDMMLQSSSALCVPQRGGLLAWVPVCDLSVEEAGIPGESYRGDLQGQEKKSYVTPYARSRFPLPLPPPQPPP